MTERTCLIGDCEKPVKARGWCSIHYARWHKHGSPLAKVGERLVQVEACIECGAPTASGGSKNRCNRHYQIWRRNDREDTPRCSVDGCQKPAISKGICETHRGRLRRTGSIEGVGRGAKPWREFVTYDAAHMRVNARRGRAKTHDCAHCGCPAHDWAYTHDDPDALVSDKHGCEYSLSPEHYTPLCKSCHRVYDLEWRNEQAVG